MAEHFKGLVDRWNRPIERASLTAEIAAATLGGVRSPLTSYPADGLDPGRLAAILRAADQGDPLAYLELAETIEERDLHYAGVLATRKRSVSQLDITVKAAGVDARQVEQAEMVQDWLTRDELSDELFDMLDAVGKGYSFTEIIWDTSEGQWRPRRLEWRDPRWFRFDRIDGQTPLMLGPGGEEQPLPGYKFIRATMRAKSGLPVRSGLARLAVWGWMFKAFTQRDWAIFTQTYGQPVRIGKYGPGSTEKDRATLFRAVANIAADCAAIIPDSMTIEFVEAKTGATSLDLYERRSDWLDRQVSKAVLGQTATTDAIAGGHAVGKEHRLVQEDIERADAKALAAIINRDLIVPWITLEYGPQATYPCARIGRGEATDVKLAVDSVHRLVPLGFKVGSRQMRDLIGLGEPAEDDELLTPPAALPAAAPAPATPEPLSALPTTPADAIADATSRGTRRPLAAILDELRAIVAGADSLEEMQAAIEAVAGALPAADLDAIMRQALILAELTGRAEIGDG